MVFHTYRSSVYQARTIYSVSTSTATYALLEDQAVDLTGSDRSNPRVTFVSITPPESLQSMLAQIAGNWSASRPNAAVPGRSVVPAGVGQVHLDGHVYSVGTDWLVRIGNVTQPGGVHKGIVIEVNRGFSFLQDLDTTDIGFSSGGIPSCTRSPLFSWHTRGFGDRDRIPNRNYSQII
jgi:hypothetical protein